MNNEISWGEEYPISELFSKYDYFKKGNRSCPTKEGIRNILTNTIEAMGLPNFLSSFPEDVYNQYILEGFAIVLWNSVSSALRLNLSRQNITPSTLTFTKKSEVLKGRILGIEGYYPNIEVRKDNNSYSFRNSIPFLITNDEKSYIGNSDVSFLNEAELRFSASVILSPNYPRCSFYFDNYYVTRIDKRAFDGLSHQEMSDLMFELLNIRTVKEKRPTFFSGQEIGAKPYRFQKFDENMDDFNSLYDGIDKNDQLTMRTLFYLVKSSMLWANMCFGEDAISNALFSVEGALLLLQRKEGHSDRNINIDLLTEIFRNSFNRGEQLFDFIREGYEKRVSIVHACPKSGVEWTPFLMADDFYEYFNISRMLLVYIILDRVTDLD